MKYGCSDAPNSIVSLQPWVPSSTTWTSIILPLGTRRTYVIIYREDSISIDKSHFAFLVMWEQDDLLFQQTLKEKFTEGHQKTNVFSYIT